jgi:hypothetical protein
MLRASFIAVRSEGTRSPRTSREIDEWSTPERSASCRCDIFLTLSWLPNHSLKPAALRAEKARSRIVVGARVVAIAVSPTPWGRVQPRLPNSNRPVNGSARHGSFGTFG